MPLDSKSRSGKLIDRIIRRLEMFEPHVDYSVTCDKSNLFDLEYMPTVYDRVDALTEWANRVSRANGDVIVSLGRCVNEVFGSLSDIHLGHPSGVWSREKKNQYVRRALKKIRAAL